MTPAAISITLWLRALCFLRTCPIPSPRARVLRPSGQSLRIATKENEKELEQASLCTRIFYRLPRDKRSPDPLCKGSADFVARQPLTFHNDDVPMQRCLPDSFFIAHSLASKDPAACDSSHMSAFELIHYLQGGSGWLCIDGA